MASDDTYLDSHQGEFEPETARLFEVLAAGSRVALDVGANVGCSALLLSPLAQVVHAFEPSLSTHQWLAMNIRNAAVPNVHTYPIGLGDAGKSSHITFAPSDRSGGFVSNDLQLGGHTTEQIEIRRLDDVSLQYGFGPIDFIKIDVEGYELRVLDGAAETLRQHRPVVTLEMNHFALNVLQRVALPDFIDYLTTAFSNAYAVHEGRRLDLHNPQQRYVTMYRHVVQGKFAAIVLAQDEHKLARFLAEYPISD